MDVTPYHAVAASPARQRAAIAASNSKVAKPLIYHTRTECPIGAKIPAAKRRLGKDKRERCAKCATLGRVSARK
jgi:hypothetical protein